MICPNCKEDMTKYEFKELKKYICENPKCWIGEVTICDNPQCGKVVTTLITAKK